MIDRSALEEIELPAGMRCYTTQGHLSVVVLPSEMCFPVPLDRPLRKPAERDSLSYELENEVPVDAECMAFDLLTAGSKSLAIVADARMVADVLQAADLADAKKMCLAVVPRPVLIAQRLLQGGAENKIVCVVAGNQIDVLRFCSGRLTAWRWLSSGDGDAAQVVAQWQAEDENAVQDVWVVGQNDDPVRQRLADELAEAQLCAADALELQYDAAKEILAGRSLPLVNFRSGDLAFVNPQRPARSAGVVCGLAVVILLTLTATGFFWRAQKYHARTVELTQKQEQLYQGLFPGQPIPVGMMGRFESEYRRLVATKDASSVPSLGSSLPAMHAFWQGLPNSARYRANMLHFVPGMLLRIDGSAKGFSDLEVLKTALVDVGFEVPPISATQTSQGASLRWDRIPWSSKEEASSDTVDGESTAEKLEDQRKGNEA